MKIVGVIPSRYGSTRLPGKPLLDICGKPMLWWVYYQAKKVKEFDNVYVATDDKRIEDMCHEYGMNVVMTGEHDIHIARIHEVSERVQADYYVNINGDEPLVSTDAIRLIIPDKVETNIPVMWQLMKTISDPVELMDTSNIKVVVDSNNEGLMLSRTPIPTPYRSILFDYKKTVGIQCFNKAALDFCVNTEPGRLEIIEGITPLRFLENGVRIRYKQVDEESLSVDTFRDVEKVRKMMQEKLDNNEL